MSHPPLELRSDQRHDVRIPGRCRTSTGYECSVIVTDLSSSGCGLKGNWVGLSPGQRVSLANGNGLTTSGVLRWCTHSTAGVQFDSRITPQIVNRLAKTYPASPARGHA